MDLQITPAGPDERARLTALFELYVYDFSELLGFDVAEDGRFHPPPSVDAYWSDPRRHPFLIRVDGKLAGFALVAQGSRLADDADVFDMDQFFVLRKYRRHGVGERAAAFLFARFAGRWEVRVRVENPAAAVFWRRAVGRFTDGKFEDLIFDDERWKGAVQRFDSRR